MFVLSSLISMLSPLEHLERALHQSAQIPKRLFPKKSTADWGVMGVEQAIPFEVYPRDLLPISKEYIPVAPFKERLFGSGEIEDEIPGRKEKSG